LSKYEGYFCAHIACYVTCYVTCYMHSHIPCNLSVATCWQQEQLDTQRPPTCWYNIGIYGVT